MNLGLSIKKLRTHLNISQKEMAAYCELSQNSLSQIECGLKNPKEKTVERICAVLNIPMSLLYLIAIEEKDVPVSRRDHFQVLKMSITNIAMQVARLERTPEPMAMVA